jgi:hypothetical protein
MECISCCAPRSVLLPNIKKGRNTDFPKYPAVLWNDEQNAIGLDTKAQPSKKLPVRTKRTSDTSRHDNKKRTNKKTTIEFNPVILASPTERPSDETVWVCHLVNSLILLDRELAYDLRLEERYEPLFSTVRAGKRISN